MYHPRLYGDYEEMGHKYGSLLRQKANFSLPQISPKKEAFGLASYEHLQDFYPEIIPEIQGFAAGIEDDPKQVAAFLLSLGVFETAGQCSIFAFNNKDSVVVGRNYDMLYAFRKFTESSLVAPTNKYAYIAQSDVFIGRSDGINEQGVFVAISFVNGNKVQPGISFHFLVRKILEDCCSTEEAIQLISEAHVATSNNFLIADATGNLAVVESAPQGYHVRRPAEGKDFVYCTNQFISKPMQNFDKGGVIWSKSALRAESLRMQLQKQHAMNLTDAKAVLANKEVCLHLSKQRFGTIWSVVANLNSLDIERAESKPKPNNYKVESRLNWWLNKRQKCKKAY